MFQSFSEINLVENLNPEQARAVLLPRESALILAGAGSGKTKVLTTRIAYLIQSHQASPGAILAVTFTNKAAREMLTRIGSMMPINTRGMWVGTFHGLCNRMLRAHFKESGLPSSFQILDSADQASAIKRVIRAMGVDEERFKPKEVGWFINGCKEQGLRARVVEAPDEFTRKQVEIYAAYDAQCQREGVVDFAELLLRCYELLKNNAALMTHYQQRFRYILVDEFQDTNRLQYAWIKLLAGADPCILAVGDDDQSIYGFRGAEAANMREFERDFARGNLIKLEQNYRSFGAILDAANAVISHNNDRLGKNLWTDAGKGELVRVFSAATDLEESTFIVEEVRALQREGNNLRDMALLYRSNAQSRVLEHALFRANVQYKVTGGLRFFERQEIKHALGYLRLAGNPDDDGAFTRVINFPPRGIGARTVEQVQALAVRDGVSLYAACENAIANRELTGRAGVAINNFLQMLEGLKASAEKITMPELIQEMLERSGLNQHYKLEKEGEDRLENLGELVSATALFQEEYDGEEPLLTAFLAHASLESGEREAGVGDDALQLMSVHASKGLEFNAVFVVGVEEGLFPHTNSLNNLDGVEEERRLMYVAITRARNRLYITHAGQRMLHGQTQYGVVSRFVEEIPAELCKWIVLPEKAATYNHYASSGRQNQYGSGGSNNYGGNHFGVRPPDAGFNGQVDSARAKFEGNNSPYKTGANVSHAKFGDGVVIAIEGLGDDSRIQIKFRDHGPKWLLLSLAKLTEK